MHTNAVKIHVFNFYDYSGTFASTIFFIVVNTISDSNSHRLVENWQCRTGNASENTSALKPNQFVDKFSVVPFYVCILLFMYLQFCSHTNRNKPTKCLHNDSLQSTWVIVNIDMGFNSREIITMFSIDRLLRSFMRRDKTVVQWDFLQNEFCVYTKCNSWRSFRINCKWLSKQLKWMKLFLVYWFFSNKMIISSPKQRNYACIFHITSRKLLNWLDVKLHNLHICIRCTILLLNFVSKIHSSVMMSSRTSYSISETPLTMNWADYELSNIMATKRRIVWIKMLFCI